MAIPDMTFWQSITEKDCHEFKAITKNETQNKDLTDKISEINFLYDGKSNHIRSIKATFSIEEPSALKNGDIISITMTNADGSYTLELLRGAAKLRQKTFYASIKYSLDVEVMSDIDNLYEKTVAQDTFFFSNWMGLKKTRKN